jgi:hypothetical protein
MMFILFQLYVASLRLDLASAPLLPPALRLWAVHSAGLWMLDAAQSLKEI